MAVTRDEEIGRTLNRLRGNHSQNRVAQAMRDRGHKWSQATVWSVEKGERPLRLTEAEDLAAFLRCDVKDILTSGGHAANEVRLLADASIDKLRTVTVALDDALPAALRVRDARSRYLGTVGRVRDLPEVFAAPDAIFQAALVLRPGALTVAAWLNMLGDWGLHEIHGWAEMLAEQEERGR